MTTENCMFTVSNDQMGELAFPGIHPDSETALRLVTETILIPESLRNGAKVTVRPSTIHGRGLFATTSFSPGDLLTIYPPHVGVFFPEGRSIHPDMLVVKHGLVHRMIDHEVLFSETLLRQYESYNMKISDQLTIVGLPMYDQDSRLLAHFANDGARGHTVADKPVYERVAKQKNNAAFIRYCSVFVALVATKPIDSDEEILVTYGHEYWTSITRG